MIFEDFVRSEDAFDDNNEVIYVQHRNDINIDKIKQELINFIDNGDTGELSFIEVHNSPVYLTSYTNNKLVISRKFDRFLQLAPNT